MYHDVIEATIRYNFKNEILCTIFNLAQRLSVVYKAKYTITLRGQTVHWIGAQFCVCISWIPETSL